MDKERFYCRLLDIIQENVDFKIRFIKTYQPGKERVPLIMREGQPDKNQCYPSVYIGNAYAAYCNGSTVRQIAEKTIEKLRNSVRFVEPSFAGGITGRNFCDIRDRVFIAETNIITGHDLLRVWQVGDLYFTYLVDISMDRDFSVFVPVLRNTLSMADMMSEDIFDVACYNMEMNTKVGITVVGMSGYCDDEKRIPLYQALPMLSRLSENPTCIALLEMEPSYMSLSILVMDELLYSIGQYIGRDYCIFQMAEGFCSVALVSRRVIEQRGELLSEMFKAVYKLHNSEELQPTQHIFYYSCNERVLYVM